METSTIEGPKVVSPAEWEAARKELLIKEKALTRQRDEVDRQRRELPWVKVEKEYLFDGPDGQETLADLFEGRSQLIVQHFMFGPGWKEGCVGCSFKADHVDAALQHIERHDVKFVAISRAPLAGIVAFQRRMAWRFKWVSSYANDFNYDYHCPTPTTRSPPARSTITTTCATSSVRNSPATASFIKTPPETSSTYGRGDEMLVGAYVYLDLTPKGRNETGPRHNLTDWVRHHDRYDAPGTVNHQGRYVAAAHADSQCACGKDHQ
jgi:predicted dithiol-disulfide oxidoreductase (DUF899 family)